MDRRQRSFWLFKVLSTFQDGFELMKKILLLAIIAILGTPGCGPSETALKAKSDAKASPALCKEALKDSSIARDGLELGSESSMYKWSFYFTCLEQEAIRNPGICSDVLAAGPILSQELTTKQNVYKMQEFVTCKNFASRAIDMQNISLLKIDRGVYDDDADRPNVVIGRIQSAQVENISTAGTSGGSQLGAGIGQIAYLESKKDLSGYNPWSQLGAGIAGALVGSTLDQPGKIQFRKTYWIKTNKGEFVSFGHIDTKSGSLPETMCVAVIDKSKIQQAKEALCSKKK